VVENQRVFHRRQLLIETNLVFVQVLAADETAFVIRFLGAAFSGVVRYSSAFDAVAADLFETRTAAVNQNHRFDDLLDSELRLFILWLSFRRPGLLRLRLLRLRALRFGVLRPGFLRFRRERIYYRKQGENYEGEN